MFATWRIGDWKDWFLPEIGVWRLKIHPWSRTEQEEDDDDGWID
jgi:hypothetical protein